MKLRLILRKPKVRQGLKRWGILCLWLAGAGSGIALVFFVSFYIAMRVEMRSTEVQVPDLVGLDLDAATQRVAPLDLVLQVDDQQNDAAVPSGHVLEQMPPADSSVRRGRKVKLVLSLGGKVLEVPDLIGHAAREVRIELRQGGFAPGDEARIPHRDSAPGTVVAQVPPAHTPAVPNTRVYPLVSDGPAPARWIMPDLLGLPREQAERWIALAGFRRGAVRQVRMSGRLPGTVVGQLPLAGYAVLTNDVVELTVAR